MEIFYDVVAALKRSNSHFTILLGDFNVKIGDKLIERKLFKMRMCCTTSQSVVTIDLSKRTCCWSSKDKSIKGYVRSKKVDLFVLNHQNIRYKQFYYCLISLVPLCCWHVPSVRVQVSTAHRRTRKTQHSSLLFVVRLRSWKSFYILVYVDQAFSYSNNILISWKLSHWSFIVGFIFIYIESIFLTLFNYIVNHL